MNQKAAAGVRHATLVNQELITRHGTMKLNYRGQVTNLAELNISKAQALEIPDILDEEVHPTPIAESVLKDTGAPVPQAPTTGGNTQTAQVDEAALRASVKEVVKGLRADPAIVRNGEGYLDMAAVTEALKKKELKPITGTLRKELEDELKAEEAAAATGGEGK